MSKEISWLDDSSQLDSILTSFPPVDLAFAYGSGAVKQGSYNYSLDKDIENVEYPMLDLIFAVEDSEAWHKLNKERNRHHYTSILDLNASQIGKVQRSIGARVWFNAMVPMPRLTSTITCSNRLLKYGVIETSDLQKDLTTWETLYIAGRLHKPVQLLKSNGYLDFCMDANREYAVYTALSLLPRRFTEQELFMTIASLSYTGDPRMFVGENPQKVKNLVEPILPEYRMLYERYLENVDSNLLQSAEVFGRRSYVMDRSLGALKHVQDHLPQSVKKVFLPTNREVDPRESISYAVRAIVRRSATMQTAKGLFTIGAKKSIVYATKKIAKRFL